MTAERGALFDEGPTACPFLALESDRERRADEPDARHRCYATPVPEPRAIAHQRTYCLTPTFGACPIFQDWAVRAAARPVPLRAVPSMPPPMTEAERMATLEAAAQAPIERHDRPQPDQVSLFDESATHDVGEEEALQKPVETSASAFKATPSQTVLPPPNRPRPYAPTPKPAAAPSPSPKNPIRGKPTLRKEDIVPAWERSRHDLPSGDRGAGRRGGDMFSRFTLLFSAFAILALAVLVILLVPLLLSSRPGTATPRPSTAANASPTPSAAPTSTPTPQSTWLTYTIKLGDNLYRIATNFNITYDQLLAANPQITNPDFIRAGDVINIPPPEFLPPSPTGLPSPSASAPASP